MGRTNKRRCHNCGEYHKVGENCKKYDKSPKNYKKLKKKSKKPYFKEPNFDEWD